MRVLADMSRPVRVNAGVATRKYGVGVSTSRYLVEGDPVTFAALQTNSDDMARPSKFMYSGVIENDNEDGTYNIHPDGEALLVRNVSYKRICRDDGTPARMRPAGAPVYPPTRKRRIIRGATKDFLWRHDGIFSQRLDPDEGLPMQHRIKYAVSIALFMGGKWVDVEEPEEMSLHDIMNCSPEERDMHLKALVDFTEQAFHADASAHEFSEWMGDVRPFGESTDAEKKARAEVYDKHAQFFPAHGLAEASGAGGSDSLR